MTLDETICYNKKVAEEREELYGLCGLDSSQCDGTKDCKILKDGKNKGCLKCAKEHKQLAEWLTELKQFRKQQTCDDCVSRQAAKEELEDRFRQLQNIGSDDRYETKFCLDTILELPSITSQQKMGQWIEHDTEHSIYYDCSLCGCTAPSVEFADCIIQLKLSKYCPNCGAKMQEVEDD